MESRNNVTNLVISTPGQPKPPTTLVWFLEFAAFSSSCPSLPALIGVKGGRECDVTFTFREDEDPKTLQDASQTYGPNVYLFPLSCVQQLF